MGVTIRDVAKQADVSVATVSRALRGHATVSTATRERVEAAAAALDYVLPFRSEATLRTRPIRVAAVMPHIGRWYFAQVLSGIQSVLSDREGELLVVRPFDRQNRLRSLVDLLDGNVVDAAVVVSLSISEMEIATLRERGIGISLLGTTHPHVSNVAIDDVEAARQLTSHFIEQGHSRIGLISSAPFDPTPSMVAVNRRNGFHQALAQAGLKTDSSLEVHSDYSIRGAQRAVERLFSLEDPPTAIVAESDELAFGVMTAARQHGLRIPEDLSVGGIDNHDLSEAWDLTTIAQPVASLAELATWQAISKSEGYASVVMPTSLIVRGTSMHPHQ